MIKNLIFDLGGVLLDINFRNTYDAFSKLGVMNAADLHDHPELFDLFMALEKGIYTPEGFHKRFRVLTGFNGCNYDLDDAFNALLVGFRMERVERVRELGLKYRTYILSNTNAIHCEHYNWMIAQAMNIKNLDQLVDKAYYSHILGSRKPDPEIYLKMIEDSGVIPEESLFLDDREENIEAARKLGFQAILVDEKHNVIEALKDL
jgi:putative hydrolase of the HAD superfamily